MKKDIHSILPSSSLSIFVIRVGESLQSSESVTKSDSSPLMHRIEENTGFEMMPVFPSSTAKFGRIYQADCIFEFGRRPFCNQLSPFNHSIGLHANACYLLNQNEADGLRHDIGSAPTINMIRELNNESCQRLSFLRFPDE